ncbi:MAG: hypothetical protein WKG07_42095 [Hymenobacter sp.]
MQDVINRRRPNNGLLLSSVSPTLPNRAVIGGPRNTLNKLEAAALFYYGRVRAAASRRSSF